ncbi:MAG: peptide deformylase [Thermovenabulum sp.]|uniref:peptide deformylase n=1 Tax=Thermovenabulum sp. TaxID=3100335 RepID=UPI003C7EC63E
MAYREIRKLGDEVLRKKALEVTVFDNRLKMLIEDMVETMKKANGIGLAAPQVGILKRVVVIDIGEGLYTFVNPEIIEMSGEIIDIEGCLSIPGVYGEVARPKKLKVKAQDEKGLSFEIEAEGLFARAICHEVDHLNGVLFIDKAKNIIEEKKDEA